MDRHISSTLLGCLNIGYMPKISLFTIISPNWNPIQHATNWRLTDHFWDTPAHRHRPHRVSTACSLRHSKAVSVLLTLLNPTLEDLKFHVLPGGAPQISTPGEPRNEKKRLMGFGAAGKLRSVRWWWFICSYLMVYYIYIYIYMYTCIYIYMSLYVIICLHVANLTSNLLIFDKGMVTS